MADNSANVAIMARFLALTHIGVGVLLICFGIADSITSRYNDQGDFFTGYMYFGVWIGVWMCVTGGLGIPGSGRESTGSRNCLAGVYMGFSITSAVFGGIIIAFYSMQIDFNKDIRENYNFEQKHFFDTQMAISAIMLILGIAEFAIGIWAAICCCLMKPCCSQQQYQVLMDTANPGPCGIPVALPGAHGYQYQVVSMPVAAMGYGAVPVTGYLSQQAGKLPPPV